MMNTLKAALRPLQRRIANMLARGVVQLVSDASGIQVVQVSLLADETQDGVERLQNYGFTSVPPVGSECLVVFLGGNRDHPVALAVDNRSSRKKALQPGDTALYTENTNYIHLKRAANGDIVISAMDGNVRIEGKTVTLSATDTLRLESASVQLHGTTDLKLDAGGTGVHYLPGVINNYTVGATTNPLPIVPPEIP